MDAIWFETAIKRWQRDGIIEQILSVKMVSTGDENEGYVSQISFAALEVMLRSGRKTTMRFVVKRLPSGEFERAMEAKCGFFKYEIRIYSGLLQSMENLMEVNNDPRGKMWPRFYGNWKNNTIILEDITARGYELVDRRKLADLDLSWLVMNSIARYHAMGLVLIRRNEIEINEWSSFIFDVEEMLQCISLRSLKDLAQEMVDSWGTEWEEIGRKIKKLTESIPELLKELLNPEYSVLNVLNHGDVKSTNLMIKRDHLGRPVKCKFLDFQIPHYNTFATDLHFFMIASIIPELRRKNRVQLLTAYYSSLRETLTLHGYPIHEIPSLSQLEDEMKRASLIGFISIPLAAGLTSDIQEKLNFQADCSSERANFRTDKFKNYFGEDIKNFINEGYI